MPDHPSYVHKLAGILAEARAPKPIPFFRRRDVEALFGLKKRRDLARWLEGKIALPEVVAERQRHERVIDRIVELKAETAARAVKIVLPEQASGAEWPTGVSLQPGVLTVSFESEQQLFERLFLLARVLATRPEVLSARGAE